MASFTNETFEQQEIVLDGNNYKNCKFNQCIISYEGGTLPSLDGNDFIDCRWAFGGAASRTIVFMKGLYNGGGRDLINATIAQITSKESQYGQGAKE